MINAFVRIGAVFTVLMASMSLFVSPVQAETITWRSTSAATPADSVPDIGNLRFAAASCESPRLSFTGTVGETYKLELQRHPLWYMEREIADRAHSFAFVTPLLDGYEQTANPHDFVVEKQSAFRLEFLHELHREGEDPRKSFGIFYLEVTRISDGASWVSRELWSSIMECPVQ